MTLSLTLSSDQHARAVAALGVSQGLLTAGVPRDATDGELVEFLRLSLSSMVMDVERQSAEVAPF